jgi:hypothetical protein
VAPPEPTEKLLVATIDHRRVLEERQNVRSCGHQFRATSFEPYGMRQNVVDTFGLRLVLKPQMAIRADLKRPSSRSPVRVRRITIGIPLPAVQIQVPLRPPSRRHRSGRASRTCRTARTATRGNFDAVPFCDHEQRLCGGALVLPAGFGEIHRAGRSRGERRRRRADRKAFLQNLIAADPERR